MRRTSGLLAVLLFLAGIVPAAAQTRTITGRVIDSLDGQAVTSGQVSIRGSSVTTTIGDQGTFSIAAPLGQVELQIRSIGFKRKDLIVPASQNAVVAALQRDYFQLEAIVVNGQSSGWNRYNPYPGEYPTGEEYNHFAENHFLRTESKPLSTFSIDVDRASYSNVRRFITQGARPPVDAVRIEEMVNYFAYDYPEPRGDQPFSVTTEVTTAPWATSHKLLRIGLKGRSMAAADLPANNLVFLIDVSGSMEDANKLPLLKSALRMLVSQLRPQDRVAMVTYAGAAGLVLSPTAGNQKDSIFDAIDRLEAGGSTAGAAGIQLAYDVARKHHLDNGNNRVILATDGDFNVGISGEEQLIRLIEFERDHGTFLTVLGFGMGNLKDSKMEQLADHGNGNYGYIDNLLEARKELVTEIGGTLLTIAKDVKIQVEFNPARVASYRLIGYENRMLQAEDFRNDQKDAGEIGAGHTVTALYEIVPVGAPDAVDSLRYTVAPATLRTSAAASQELGIVKLRYKKPNSSTSLGLQQVVLDQAGDPSTDLTFAAAVAGFGMQLRESDNRGNWTLDDILEAARRSIGKDLEGERREFARLVESVMQGRLLAKAPEN